VPTASATVIHTQNHNQTVVPTASAAVIHTQNHNQTVMPTASAAVIHPPNHNQTVVPTASAAGYSACKISGFNEALKTTYLGEEINLQNKLFKLIMSGNQLRKEM
jgi:hypothetical protein